MRELTYAVLELQRWNKKTCDFCSNRYGKDNKAVCQVITRSKLSGELIENDVACESCKEKLENDELLKCNRCGRLQTKLDFDIISGKNICYCIRNNEDIEEKELPLLPDEEISQAAFYERQINGLRKKERELTEEIDTHLEALEIAEDWHKRQKQELLDRIKGLEAEVERLRKLTPQELVDKLNAKEKEVSELKAQLDKLTSQQTTQIEVKKQHSWLRFKK